MHQPPVSIDNLKIPFYITDYIVRSLFPRAQTFAIRMLKSCQTKRTSDVLNNIKDCYSRENCFEREFQQEILLDTF